MRPAALVLVGLGAWLLLSQRAEASVPGEDWGGVDPEGSPEGWTEAADDFSDPWVLDPSIWGTDGSIVDPGFGFGFGDDMQPLRAFLYMIRRAEHTASDVASGADYRTFYGGSRFSGMADHPVATGEKRGIKLPDEWCRKAGLGPGCVSTAAGAYQMRLPTWQRVRGQGPWLPDFSPDSQDQAALRLIAEKGATSLIRQGRVDEAVALVAPVWASLAGSTSGQPQKTLAQLRDYYAAGLALA